MSVHDLYCTLDLSCDQRRYDNGRKLFEMLFLLGCISVGVSNLEYYDSPL